MALWICFVFPYALDKGESVLLLVKCAHEIVTMWECVSLLKCHCVFNKIITLGNQNLPQLSAMGHLFRIAWKNIIHVKFLLKTKGTNVLNPVNEDNAQSYYRLISISDS